jgi:hypothetical protein
MAQLIPPPGEHADEDVEDESTTTSGTPDASDVEEESSRMKEQKVSATPNTPPQSIDICTMATVRLEFDDFLDLQTRLVLLPLDEEEGAFVASYTPKESYNENAGKVSKESTPDDDSDGNDAPEEKTETQVALPTDATEADESIKPSEGDEALSAENSEAEVSSKPAKGDDAMPTENTEADESNKPTEGDGAFPNETKVEALECIEPTEDSDEPSNVVGMVLCGIATDDSGTAHFVNCIEKDFTSIFSMIREAPVPIVLLLQPPSEEYADKEVEERAELKEQREERPDDDLSTTTSGTPEERDVESEVVPKMMQTRPEEVSTTSMLGNRLSSWGSKVRATSAVLAAEAKVRATSAILAAEAAASEASERARASRLPEQNQPNIEASAVGTQSQCSLFLQNSDGKFIPLSEGNPKVTTSSVVHVRQSALQACPSHGYEYQWYRSYRPPPPNGSISDASSKPGTEDGSVSSGPLEWICLPGATHAAYQPSATDVGHALSCVVRIAEECDSGDGEMSEERDDTVTCTTSNVVCADMCLFSAATQALTRGAKFGNLVGRGHAEGRLFRVHIEMTRSISEDTKSMDVTSALTIFQISGNTAEPLHDEPILGATAVSDPSRPKDFDLVIPVGAASMVSVLSNDGRFQLQAPNRITRESLLLALGVANYRGKPADLSVQTILYPGLQSDDTIETLRELGVTPVKRLVAEEVEFYTPQENSHDTEAIDGAEASPNDRVKELEQELHRVLSKMSRKDKVISDLQRTLTQSNTKVQKTETSLSSCKIELELKRKEFQECRSSLRSAERRIGTLDDTMRRLKGDHAAHIEALEKRIISQSEKIAELEKNVRSLQNEKAVLSAAVEARDCKLSKMEELQTAVNKLSEKVSKGDSVKLELNDMSQRYIEISQDLEKVSTFEKECRDELQQTRATMKDLQKRLTKEQEKKVASQSQVETLQVKMQQLQAERNNYKQKADSLSKEVSRLCKNGRTLRDIEKIVLDEDSRQMEVSLLKSQKRQALEDLHHYRTAYEQTIMAQHKAGMDGEAMRALEQKAELERVISDMTEYVNAKEMQLETLKQVNQALSEELHMLAQASMSKNDI